MKARFFCDHCGREVKAGAARCPGCGRFFSAVKCPRCAFQGDAKLFASGCPACGYLFAPEEKTARTATRKKSGESSLSKRTFVWLTALLVILLVIFLVLLLVQPFNR